jgi:hypothetical protein
MTEAFEPHSAAAWPHEASHLEPTDQTSTLDEVGVNEPPTSPAPAVESIPTNGRRRKPAKPKHPREWIDRMSVSYYDIALVHILKPGGVLAREIHVNSVRMRQVLGQPRRRPLPPLRARQEHFELRTSEVWEQAEFEAPSIVRQIYAEFRGRLQLPAGKAGARVRPPRGVSAVIPPVDWEDEARGILLQTQEGSNGEYEIYLWEPESARTLRLTSPDLKRAWEQSRTQLYDAVQVIPRGEQTIPVEEERTGRFGDSRRIVRHKRKLFEIRRTTGAPVVSYATPRRS